MSRDCIADCVQHHNLEVLGQLVDAGQLKVHLDEIYDLANIQGAINHQIKFDFHPLEVHSFYIFSIIVQFS